MSHNLSQKSNSDSKMTIEEEDLCTYWLVKVWPVYSIDFEQFKDIMRNKGIEIINTRDFIAF